MKHIKKIITVFVLIALFARDIQAQEHIPPRYCVKLKYNFEGWGKCINEPTFERAYVILKFEDEQIYVKRITPDSLDQELTFDRDLFNPEADKDLGSLKDDSENSFEGMTIVTEAANIRHDKILEHDLSLDDLMIGESKPPIKMTASDPCGLFHNKREGYDVTTTLYIDDPIFISNNGDKQYVLDYESLTLHVSDFYKNKRPEKPYLEVFMDNINGWERIENVNIIPNSDVQLSYSQIAGAKDAVNTNYYDWMGEFLQFRVVKTLMNGKKTVGNIEGGIRFYPEGLQYEITQTRRSSCKNKVNIYVKMESDLDEGYLNLNTDLFFWRVRSPDDMYNCIMKPTGDPLKFEIITEDDGFPTDPFNQPDDQDIEWTLQLIDKNPQSESSVACERTFTIPKKPEDITITQSEALIPVPTGGTKYHILNLNDPYVVLNIVDPYDFAHLRRPYKIVLDSDTLKTIDKLPNTYENMTQHQRDSVDDVFKQEFDSLVNLKEDSGNPYFSYFALKYKNWLDDQNMTITHPDGSVQFSVYEYHQHYHSHSCTHTHTVERGCILDETNPGDPHLVCQTGLAIENTPPHDLCNSTHIPLNPEDWEWVDDINLEHTHVRGHNHLHTHDDGLHNHGDNTNYDYTVIRIQPLPNGEISNHSSPYNNVTSYSAVSTGFNAKYVLNIQGTEVNVPIWTKSDIMDNIYPNNGIAQSWYNDYRDLFKEKWLNERLGIRISEKIVANNPQYLKLIDKDKCEYNITSTNGYTLVKAPAVAIFDTSEVNYPSDACSVNGTAKITYVGGGNPPYYRPEGTLSQNGESIIIDNLDYGDNPIIFYDSSLLNETARKNVSLESIEDGITSIDTLPQTCSEPNGKITINTKNLPGPVTYTLINKATNDKLTHNQNQNSGSYSHTFDALYAGTYNAIVLCGTCSPIEHENIIVNNNVFQIKTPITTNATEFEGKGSVSLTFVNRTDAVTWLSGVPQEFNVTENSNSINYTNVSPGTYNFSASHNDTYGRTCNVQGNFVINEPSFEATINITETDDNANVSVSLIEGNSLITPYKFRLFNSSNAEIAAGEENSLLASTIETPDDYTLIMEYGINDKVLYTFTYPSTPITNTHSVTAPLCPGWDGSILLTSSGGIDGTGHLISTDGATYTTDVNFNVKGGDFTYFIKDENISTIDVSGNAITLNRSVVNSFTVEIPEPEHVYAEIVMPVDVTCFGANDGSISIDNLTGGSGTYQYRVDNGSWADPLTDITGLAPGNHILYLQDNGNDCPVVTLSYFNLDEPEVLEIDSISIIHPTCELENGEIYVEAQGGNGFFQFDWSYNNEPFYSSGELAEDSVTHLGDTLRHGLYRLDITDNNNCTFSQSPDLNEYFNPQINNADIADVECYAEENGEILVTDVSGTTTVNKIAIAALDFVYNDTIYDLASSFTDLKYGRYELTAIDDSACFSNSPYQLLVNQPDTIVYSITDTIVPVTIKGSNTGKIISKVYGGNDGLKDITLYDSGNIEIDQKSERNEFPLLFDSLYAGDYYLTIVDIKGCTDTLFSQTVEEPQLALGLTVTKKEDAMCKSQTGSFTVEGSGGWGEYSYKRGIGERFYDINSFENLYAGSYIVSVKDKYGAVFTDTLIIYEPKDSLHASLVDYTDPTCGNNGSLTLNLKGGVVPYKLTFESSNDTTDISGPQDYTYTNCPDGAHLLHVIDNNGCRFELETGLSDQDLLNITEFNLTHPSSSGANDGIIESFVSGGNSPLNYSWRELFGNPLSETSSVLSDVSSGHYELTVGESDGCSVTERVFLPDISNTPLEIIELTHETSYLAENGSAQLLSELEEMISVEVINPTGTRTIFDINDSNSEFNEENNIIYLNNLEGGAYFVMAVNNSGEKAYVEFVIDPYEQFYFDDIQISHAKEINESNGSINVVVAGGAGGNLFVWEYLDGTVSSLDTVNNEYTGTLRNAIAGNYRITVTDKYNNSISQTLVIEQPGEPLAITISEYTNESCKDYEDAYIVLQASGGWGDYQFKHDTEEYYSNSNNRLNLDVREHYFYLTDKMGALDSIAVTITEPDYLRANVELVDSVDCKSAIDGNILFDITGGTEPYRYAYEEQPTLWTEDTTARNLPEGTYNFIFTDSNNCVGQDTITTYMPEPDSLLFNDIDVVHTTCDIDNGAMTVTMQGGTPPYSYEWTDFGVNILGTENTVSGLNQNSRYFINVIDAHNCSQYHEQLINPSTNPLVLDVDTTPVLCNGEYTGTANIVEVSPAEPFAPYSFIWSNSDVGESADGFEAGIHSVTITDENNCSTTRFFEVTQPDTLQVVVTDFKDAHCFGYNDGFIEILASGGVGNYQFNWSSGQTTERIESLYKGVYELTITDSNNCSINETYEVIEPDELIVDLGEDVEICPGSSITIDGQDFTTHQWSESEGEISNERFITLDKVGEYFLEVTNSIGCFAHDEISVSVGNDALQADFLMPSLANLGDTFSVCEISNLNLDSLFWDFNSVVFTEITDSSIPDYLLQLKSNEMGIYSVGLAAYSGGCISTAVKQIEILPQGELNEDDGSLGYTDPIIKELTVYPNPTDGNFTLNVELRETADIEVRIFSIVYGTIVNHREEYGQDYYELGYNLNTLNTGVYVIMVTANKERKQIKVIIK